MKHCVIGTAGHIDHGKTALIKALTGVDTDRLKEEKLRGITIELGFTNMTLPSGRIVSIVDVPGHERFIKNMVAGATGIDLALLIIAADEGVMPQTIEHFDILRLLGIKRIIVVITKIELVDEDIISIVKEETRELLEGTKYTNSEIIEVSAKKEIGLSNLKMKIDEIINGLSDNGFNKKFSRLPIDRVFTVQGFGTVATGTLINGEIKTGDLLEDPFLKTTYRVRNIQVHNVQVDVAQVGQRVALNLSGEKHSLIKRGTVLATPDWLIPSNRLDMELFMLKNAHVKLKNMMRLRFYHGTTETFGKVFLLNSDEISPGEEAFVSLALEEPVVAIRGDKYIFRSLSPLATIGGGRIIEIQAIRHKKSEQNLISKLFVKANGTVRDRLKLFFKERNRIISLNDLELYFGEEIEKVNVCIDELLQAEEIYKIDLGEVYYLTKESFSNWLSTITNEIKKYQSEMPLDIGLNKEVIRTKFWPYLSVNEFNNFLDFCIIKSNLELIEGQFIIIEGYKPEISKELMEIIDNIKHKYIVSGWNIPNWSLIENENGLIKNKGKQILKYLVRKRFLIQLTGDFYIPKVLLEEAYDMIREHFSTKETLSIAEVRDLIGSSRKIAVPLLEYFDRMGVTQRIGDVRCKNMRFDSKDFHKL